MMVKGESKENTSKIRQRTNYYTVKTIMFGSYFFFTVAEFKYMYTFR